VSDRALFYRSREVFAIKSHPSGSHGSFYPFMS